MAAIINFAFDDDEDFQVPISFTDRDGNANNYASSSWKLTVKTTSASSPSLVLQSCAATVSIASPGVVTLNANGFVANQPVSLTTTGALPTGFIAGTTYYVVSPSTNTFELSATPGGSAINTTGSQSGTHTINAGIDASNQANGALTLTLPKALLTVGNYVYDLLQTVGSLQPKLIKGSITISKGIG